MAGCPEMFAASFFRRRSVPHPALGYASIHVKNLFERMANRSVIRMAILREGDCPGFPLFARRIEVRQ